LEAAMVKYVGCICLSVWLVAACSSATPPAPAASLPTEATVIAPTPTAEQAVIVPTAAEVIQPTTVPPTAIPPTEIPAPESSSYTGPSWASLALTDVRTGMAFTLADFAGKTVYVETMATWCPPCRTQLINVNQAMAQVSQEDYAFITLSLAENISNEDLARYANDNGFTMIFAITPPELLDALVGNFGFSVSNPPSTPHFTISPRGTVSDLHTGISGPDALIAELMAADAA
jgi:thiol-disulfide isomerase/thioredoxin